MGWLGALEERRAPLILTVSHDFDQVVMAEADTSLALAAEALPNVVKHSHVDVLGVRRQELHCGDVRGTN
jgi:signal transduction histidine kinase